MFKFGRHQLLWDAASDAAAAQAAAAVAGGGANGNGTGADAGKTYTQAQLDTMFAERGKQGATAKERELLAALGVGNLAEAQAKLKAATDAEAAQATDLQKATKRAEDEKKRADAAEAASTAAQARATDALLRAEVSAVALVQGVDDAELRTLWLLLRDDAGLRDRIKPKAEADGEFEGVKEVVAEMVKAHPRWLKAAPAGQPNINAGNRSIGTAVPSQQELIDRKRGQYAGTF